METTEQPTMRAGTTSGSVLVAEDDWILRKAVETTLRRSGFGVLTAQDGEEALVIARRHALDLILLDLIMPRLQGFETLRALKGDPATASIPVVIMSNLGQAEDVARTMAEGAAAYLVKSNLSLADLVRQVRLVMGRAR